MSQTCPENAQNIAIQADKDAIMAFMQYIQTNTAMLTQVIPLTIAHTILTNQY